MCCLPLLCRICQWMSRSVRALFSLIQVLIILLDGLGKIRLLDLSAVKLLLPLLDTLRGGLSGLLSLCLRLLPLFDFRSKGGLLLHGVPVDCFSFSRESLHSATFCPASAAASEYFF